METIWTQKLYWQLFNLDQLKNVFLTGQDAVNSLTPKITRWQHGSRLWPDICSHSSLEQSRTLSHLYSHFFLLSLLLSHSFLSQINYCEAQAFGQSLELYYQYLQQKNKNSTRKILSWLTFKAAWKILISISFTTLCDWKWVVIRTVPKEQYSDDSHSSSIKDSD